MTSKVPQRGFVYVVECKSCFSKTRVEVLGQAAMLKRGQLNCPCCGSVETTREYRTGEAESEYWYYLAESMGLTPSQETAAMAKSIYSLWNPTEYSHFMDFVKALETEDD